jgi:tetratricopeptide (TPR) repeat protein
VKPVHLLFFLLLAASGCQIYHDTAARYNAYFLAKEQLLQVEDELFGNPEDDYNDVLQVLVKLDTNAGKAKKAELDYCIDMAAKPIQWHKQSKWVDDCWLVVGKARLYQGDFVNASRSFKYVNTHSDDPNARHTALVLLMRSFIDMGEYENANYVDAFIRKDTIPFNNDNARDYHLTRAHFYRLQGKFDMVAKHLEVALPVTDKKLARGRNLFILGQIHQRQGDLDKAYEFYQAVLKERPSFDLEFHAKVSSYGLQEFESPDAVAEARQYYERMAKDPIHWDLRDKIYYEWAQFELRHGHEDEAVARYNEAITISKSNPAQLAYCYLRLGELAYGKQDFPRAAAYYDSAAQQMPQHFDVYAGLQERNEALLAFSKELGMLQAQDRLFMLSKMDSASLQVYLEAEVAKDREEALKRRQFEEYREQLRKQQSPPDSGTPFQQESNGAWYFFNPELVASGKVEFIKIWGNRAREDDWRRSNKPFAIAPPDDFASAGNEGEASETPADAPKDPLAGIKSVEKRKQEIPSDPSDIARMHEQIQASLFALGKISHYKLQDAKGAIPYWERLWTEYAAYDSVPEALYLAYGICQEPGSGCDAAPYKDLLTSKYPKSLYAKLLLNPGFLAEAYQDDLAAEQLYMQAYQAYQADRLDASAALLAQIQSEYEKSQYLDKAALLEAMIVGKRLAASEDKTDYYLALHGFMKQYPKSPLFGMADRLIKAIPREWVDEERLRMR